MTMSYQIGFVGARGATIRGQVAAVGAEHRTIIVAQAGRDFQLICGQAKGHGSIAQTARGNVSSTDSIVGSRRVQH